MKKITLLFILLISSISFSQAPSSVAPTPPSRNAADVVSLFSDAYTNTTIDAWSAPWDTADISDEVVSGDNVKKVTFSGFLGVDFSSSKIDLSGFTHFHIDLWTETATLDKSFNHKLSNHAGASTNETSAIEFSITNGSSPSLPNPNPGTWISYDIPLSSFSMASNSLDRESIAQYIITSNLGVVYLDNIYFYNDGSGTGSGTGNGTGNTATGDLTNWTFDDVASTNVFTKIADAATDASAAINFNAAGNGTGALELVGVNTAGGVGKNYSFRYENANFDFKGNSEFNVSFDAKFIGNYVGAAFHVGVQVPNTTSGAGVKQVNKLDLQGQVNNSTWSTIQFNISDVDFNGSNGLFIFDFQIAAGADVNAGGTILIDNLKLSSVSTASVDNNQLLGFSMYPNPAKNSLTISAKGTIQNAEVFNVLGKKVSSFKLNKTKETLDVSNLATGIYLVKYTVDGKVGTAKFIKQ